jgi:hypothetical protein
MPGQFAGSASRGSQRFPDITGQSMRAKGKLWGFEGNKGTEMAAWRVGGRASKGA